MQPELAGSMPGSSLEIMEYSQRGTRLSDYRTYVTGLRRCLRPSVFIVSHSETPGPSADARLTAIARQVDDRAVEQDKLIQSGHAWTPRTGREAAATTLRPVRVL